MNSIVFMAGIGKASVEGKVQPLCQVFSKLNLTNLDATKISESSDVKNIVLKLFLDYCLNSNPQDLGIESADKIVNDFILDLYNKSSSGKITVESIRQYVKQPINQDSETIECSVVVTYRKLKNVS